MSTGLPSEAIKTESSDDASSTSVGLSQSSPRKLEPAADAATKNASTAPPRRPMTSTTSKRPTTTIPSSTKSIPSTSSRTAPPGSGLTKPPTRPLTTGAVRKAPSAVTAPTSSSGHRSQPPTSSTDDARSSAVNATKRSSMAPVPSTRSPAPKIVSSAADRRTSTMVSSTTSRKLEAVVPNSARKPLTPSLTGTPRSRMSTGGDASARPSASSTTRSSIASVQSDVKRRIGVTTGLPTGGAKTTPRPDRAIAATQSGQMESLKERIKELEGQVEHLKPANTAGGESKSIGEGEDSTKQLATMTTKLAEYEEMVIALQEDLQSSQTKLLELGEAAARESDTVKMAEENIRIEHGARIDALQTKRHAEVLALQAEIEKLHQVHKINVESAIKEVEDGVRVASEQRETETAEALRKDEGERAKEREHLQQDLARAQEESKASAAKLSAMEANITRLKASLGEAQSTMSKTKSGHEEVLGKRDLEIKGMSQTIEDLQTSFQNEQSAKQQAVEAQAAKLTVEHTAVVDDLTQTHDATVKSLTEANDKTQTERARELTTASETHAATKQSLEQQLADVLAEQKKMESSMVHLRDAHEKALQLEQDKLKKSGEARQQLEGSKMHEMQVVRDQSAKTITSLEEKLSALAEEKATEEAAHADAKAAREQAKAKVAELESVHEMAEKSLRERELELTTVKDKHRSELKFLGDDHAAEIEALGSRLESKQKEQLKDLQSKHDSLVKTSQSLQGEHAAEIAQLKKDSAALVSRSKEADAQEVEQHKQGHARELVTLRAELETNHSQAVSSREQKHAASLAETQKELQVHQAAAAISKAELAALRQTTVEASTAEKLKTQLDELRIELASQKTSATLVQEELEAAKKATTDAGSVEMQHAQQMEELHTSLARDKDTIAKLTQHLEEAKKIQEDTSVADQLRKDVQELTVRHAAKITKINDTLAKESSARQAATDGQLKAQAALDKATQVAETHRASHARAVAEIGVHQAQASKAKETSARDIEDLNTVLTQRIESLEEEAAVANDKNKALLAQLKTAQEHASSNAAKVKEIEGELKTTLSEIQRAESGGTKPDLQTSKWAVEGAEVATAGKKDGEAAAGASFSGTLAGIQTQLTQLEEINEDLRSEASRMVNLMEGASKALVLDPTS